MSDVPHVEDTLESANPGALSRRRFGSMAIAAGVFSVLPDMAGAANARESGAAGPGGHNIDLVRQLIERGFNQNDLSVADAICAAQVSEHEYLADTGGAGAQMLKSAIQETRKALQNLQLTIEDFVESGEKVWTRSTCRGTESNTGKAVVMSVFDVYRFRDGKLVEHWGVPDRFAVLYQAGLLPGSQR